MRPSHGTAMRVCISQKRTSYQFTMIGIARNSVTMTGTMKCQYRLKNVWNVSSMVASLATDRLERSDVGVTLFRVVDFPGNRCAGALVEHDVHAGHRGVFLVYGEHAVENLALAFVGVGHRLDRCRLFLL